MVNRASEPERPFFRCSRYFSVGHQWYATTREGGDVGPFDDRAEAELELAHQLALQVTESQEQRLMGEASGEDSETTVFAVLLDEFRTCHLEARTRTPNCIYVWAKQRLEELEGSSVPTLHTAIRARALRHFLIDLDRSPS